MKPSLDLARSAAAVIAAAAVLSTPFMADAQLKGTGQPSVAFTAIGPAGMKIVGTTSDLAIKDDGQAVSVTVPLGGLKTGIDLRDKHLREKYLQVGSFPNASLSVPRAGLKFPSTGAESSGDAQGTMLLHGKSKPVTFRYTAKRDGNVFHVSGTVQLNIVDYGIEVPSYLGVTVKPDVDVAVRFDANDA